MRNIGLLNQVSQSISVVPRAAGQKSKANSKAKVVLTNFIKDVKMATYLKPTSKLFDLPSRGSGELNLTDLMCPVCRGILIEPVTLPCAHSLCLRCLNGTIQHNSLSCPLCRVRVGSWLRTATKSDTLVNDALWKFIKQKFSKEIQAKNDGVEETDLDSGFVRTTKILSAAGEIRREYETQLQIAEEERRRRHEAERIASEVLIRQIQAEEREQINQLAKDNAVAKNLAKKSLSERFVVKVNEKHESEASNERDIFQKDCEKVDYKKSKDATEWNSNIALISKLRAESYASDMKSGVSKISNNAYKTNSEKYFFQKSDELQNSVNKSVRHQPMSVQQSFIPKPSCSNSKIYGTQSKEELQVPSDVLNRKKKNLGVEVCLSDGQDERRIGSAESTGSHDSINIEIHHFKPIKAMPRTPLRTMPDGRQIDPKLIRVVAILKRVQNAVPKPPTLMQLKRLSGCSYSAFKGKSRKVPKQDLRPSITTNMVKEDVDRRPSTSTNVNLSQPQAATTSSNKLSKSQISETVRRLDLSSEISYDGNKNINRIINGTKVSKKLILDEEIELARGTNNNKTINSGDNPGKFRRRKYNSSSNDKEEFERERKIQESGDEASSSNSSANNPASFQDGQTTSDPSDNDVVPAIENIAERIKKRKMNRGRNNQHHSAASLKRRRVVEKKTNNRGSQQVSKGKHRKFGDREDSDRDFDSLRGRESSETIDQVLPTEDQNSVQIEENSLICSGGRKRATRNSAKVKNEIDVEKIRSSAKCSRVTESHENEIEIENDEEDEDEGVKEQKRIERLLIQEKKDFELAQRLQAKFDEMERISGRTRGSRRGGGGVVVSELNSKNIEQVLSGNRNVRNDGGGIKERFSKQLLIQNDQSAREQNNKRRVTRRRCVQ